MPRVTMAQLPGALKRHLREINRGIERAIKQAARDGQRLLTVSSPPEIGFFKKSWKVVGAKTGKTTITNDAPYAGMVELGMRPRKVTPAETVALREWAMRHFRRTKGDMKREALAEAVVHSIKERIAEKGIRPTYFVRGKLDAIRWIAQTAIDAELAMVAGRAGA